MEKSYIFKPPQSLWVTFKNRYMLTIKEETIKNLKWSHNQAVEVVVDNDKIIIKKINDIENIKNTV